MIERLDAASASARIGDLAVLLQDAVQAGASIGFLAPLSEADAHAYWRSLIEPLRSGELILLASSGEAGLAGAVQLAPSSKPNGSHRAEVQKLMVHTRARRPGLWAVAMGRSLLVLDTRQRDDAERLYRRLGYIEAGAIPGYARSSRGTLEATVFFYKHLLLLGQTSQE